MIFGLGVSCLQLYMQNNWVGPSTTVDPRSLLPSCCQPLLQVVWHVQVYRLELNNSETFNFFYLHFITDCMCALMVHCVSFVCRGIDYNALSGLTLFVGCREEHLA